MAGIITISEQASEPSSPAAGKWNVYSTSDGLNAQNSAGDTGLLPILSGNATDYLNGTGAWSSPAYPNRNGIINGSFRVSQRGTTFTDATTPANSDDTYLLDRWILQSDGNNIVDVSQEESSDIANPAYNIKLDVETANKKFGILTVLEYRDSRQFTNQTVSLSFKAKRTGTTIGAIRAAILSWSGIADTITSDIVTSSTDWEAAGTNPILASGWNYENTPAALSAITTSWQTYKIEGITIDTANAANVAVFIWADDTVMSAGDFLHIAEVQLEIGSVATAFEVRLFADELAKCQRYYEKIFPKASNYVILPGRCALSNAVDTAMLFAVQKFSVPSFNVSSSTDFKVRDSLNSDVICNSFSFLVWGDNRGTGVFPGVATGLTGGAATSLITNTANAFIEIISEL